MDEILKQIKSRMGRPPKDLSPSDILNSLYAYAEHCEKINKPLTREDFQIWSGIYNWTTFWNADCRQTEDFCTVKRVCELYIKGKQVREALDGAYSPVLVARINGISEKVEQRIEDKTSKRLTRDQALELLKGETE